METQVKFTREEAIAAVLKATGDGDLSLEDRVVLLASVVREQQDALAQEQQANAAHGAVIDWLKAVIEQWHNTGDTRWPLPPLYAPRSEDAGLLVEGTGTGEPPVPPRYEVRAFPAEGGTLVAHSLYGDTANTTARYEAREGVEP